MDGPGAVRADHAAHYCIGYSPDGLCYHYSHSLQCIFTILCPGLMDRSGADCAMHILFHSIGHNPSGLILTGSAVVRFPVASHSLLRQPGRFPLGYHCQPLPPLRSRRPNPLRVSPTPHYPPPPHDVSEI